MFVNYVMKMFFILHRLYYFTTTVQVAVFPFDVFTVIVAVPIPTAVTFPYLFTVATLVSLLVQV